MNADSMLNRESRKNEQNSVDWLIGGGETGEMIRSMDWSVTPLGPRGLWPQSLRTAVNMILANSYPMAVLWGSELISIYNDAYNLVAADRHPMALGRPTRDVWPEVWEFRHPILERVMMRGETVFLEDHPFLIARNGCMENAYFTLSYSPIRTEENRIEGAMVVLLETTQRVLSEQRLKLANESLEAQIAEQKRAEEALQESEKWYRSLFENMLNGFAYCQMHFDHEDRPCDFTYLSVNKAFETLTGLKNVVGKKVSEVIPGIWESDQEVMEFYGRVAKTGKSERLERFIKSLQAWYSVSAYSPKFGYFVAVFDVITERKRVQEALRESVRMHQTLLDCMPCVALLLRHKSREIVAMNKAAARAGASLGKTCFSSWAKFDKPCAFCLAPETWTSGEDRQTVVNALGVVWEAHWMPVSEDLYLHYAFDITDRERAEEAIRESDEKFRLAFTTGLDGFYWSTLEEGLIIEVNPVFENMFGYSRNEVIGKTSLQLGLYCNPDDRARMVSELKAKGQIKDLELEALKKSGEKITISISISKVTLKNQLYILGVVKDITAHKRAEREQREIQSQLQQAQKMESVGRLAGGVAHDFNNMLGVILGHAELALAQIDSSQPLHDDLTEIQKAAERSAGLTRQLLAFARRQTAAPRVLDLRETVASMLNMLQRLIGENINLNWHSAENLWSVKIDPSQLDQILANLVVNARDAITGVGTITIETKNCILDEDYCAAHTGAVPGDYIMLALSDDGCGMDNQTLANIFEPFFTTKGVGKGTGLGLSTVYGIIKQNKGFIDVSSKPGQGATFTIYLPRHVSKIEQVAEKAGVSQPARGCHETILLVEDELSLLKMTQTMLEQQGYTVLVASTPGEAIRIATECSGGIHLLITDMVMPKMNGRDLAKNLGSIYPHIKQLFMSGYTADVIENDGVLNEGIQFIQKPFALKSLAIKIREVLDQA